VRKRHLGKTDLEVSELTLGTWGLSGDAYGPMVFAEVDRVIDKAISLGITLFDTADVYGRGAMEKKLAERLPKDDTYVVTKIGTDLDTKPAQKRFDPTYLRDALLRSRDRLGREPLDIVLLHNPTERAFQEGDTVAFMKEAVAEGFVRAWGASIGSAAVGKAAIHAGVQVIELAYNAFMATDLHELSPEITRSGIGILARSVLAHGLLTGHWSADREFDEGDHRAHRWTRKELGLRIKQLDALRPAVRDDIPNLRSVALRFVLSNQLVSSAVLGPRSVFQLEHLVRDAGAPPYLKDTVMVELAARLSAAGLDV
jgi:aryl-alcohol dehydrogenase-like predicted oxidoreductase